MATEIRGHNVKVRLQCASDFVPTAAVIAATPKNEMIASSAGPADRFYYPSRYNAAAGLGIRSVSVAFMRINYTALTIPVKL
jgi:hypothetical protein